MRAKLTILAAFFAFLLAYGVSSRAAVDSVASTPAVIELLVFEHADCIYCRAFRRDIASRYAKSTSKVPLRYIDIDKADIGGMSLNARIQVLPTAVLMKDGHEVDRIVGYWAPDNFLKMLAHMIARAE
jgi:thioredoxin-related protein